MILFIIGLILGVAIGYRLKKETCNCCKKTDKPEDMEYGIKTGRR